MNKLKELKKTNYCPICKNQKFNKLGKIKSLSKRSDNIFDLVYYLHNERYIGNLHEDLDNIFDLIQCSSCKHSCLSLMPEQKFLDKLYDAGSPYLFENSEDEILTKKRFIEKKLDGINTNVNHWIFKYLKNMEPGKYFEVGPGNCILFKTFKNKGWYCEAYELQSWIEAEGIYSVFDEIPKNKNDVMVMQDVLEHVANPKEFVTKFSFFLKQSGYLFLTFPNASSYRAKIFKSKWRMIAPLSHINYFSKQSIIKLLEDCGFEPISIKPVSMVIFRKLVRSILRLPIVIILDLIKLDFLKAVRRISEIIVNVIDFISGDQMHVIAVKK